MAVDPQGRHGVLSSGEVETGMFVIREDDLSGEPTRALLALHLVGMHASSPPGTCSRSISRAC